MALPSNRGCPRLLLQQRISENVVSAAPRLGLLLQQRSMPRTAAASGAGLRARGMRTNAAQRYILSSTDNKGAELASTDVTPAAIHSNVVPPIDGLHGLGVGRGSVVAAMARARRGQAINDGRLLRSAHPLVKEWKVHNENTTAAYTAPAPSSLACIAPKQRCQARSATSCYSHPTSDARDAVLLVRGRALIL